MCNSKADGGQRCFSHAKEQYDRAVRNLRLGGHEASDAFFKAEVEYASTPQGEADLTAQRDAAEAAGDFTVVDGLETAIARGQAMRERNAAVKGAVKGAEKARDERALLATLPPTDIDARLYALYNESNENMVALDRALTRLHYAVGDSKTRTRYGQTWTKSFDETMTEVKVKIGEGGYRATQAQDALDAYEKAHREGVRLKAAADPLNAEFTRRGGWNRAFLVTNVNGHVHKDMNCSTCEPTTRYSWQTQYSGASETEIVEAAGEACCTRCYPSAPAEVLNRPTRMVSEDQAAAAVAREERATAKIARDRAKIEKALTADGSEFTVTYGEGRYDRERFKTELSATSWAVGKIVDYSPGGWNATNGRTMAPGVARAIQEIKDAIATKHNMTPAQVEEHLSKKIKAKRKREGLD